MMEVKRIWNEPGIKLNSKYFVLIIVVSFFAFILAHESFAQGGMNHKGSGGWGMQGQYSKMYDVKTVETISGKVVSVTTITPEKGMSAGVHLMLKTDKTTISVHLGPAWYIENQDIKIATGDKIEVKGSRITFEGKPAIIAAEVQKGNDMLVLRNENGIPVWSAWRQH